MPRLHDFPNEPEDAELEAEYFPHRAASIGPPSTSELLRRLVGGGGKQLASALAFTPLDTLLTFDAEALAALGLKPKQIERCQALRKLWARLAEIQLPASVIGSSKSLARYLFWRHAQQQMRAGVLFVNRNGQIIDEELLFEGGLDLLAIDRRRILRRALALSAARIVVFQHRGGVVAYPSKEQLQLCKSMDQAALAVGLRLVDYLILGTHREYWSMKEAVESGNFEL